jgi:hypothetical protein
MKILLGGTILALINHERQPFYWLAFSKLSNHRKSICNNYSGTHIFQSPNCTMTGPYSLSNELSSEGHLVLSLSISDIISFP